MNRILQTLCAYLCIFSVTANAAGPTIWGPDSRALNLTTQGYTLQSGVTLDNDGITNFVKAATAETSTQPAAWSTYADAAQTTPVDCTGGSANVTWTRNTTTPLRGAADFKLTKDAANRQGQGVAYAFTTGPSDGVGELLTITMPVKATEDAAYATGDIGVYVYNVTGTALITPTIVNVEDSAYQFTAQFNLASSSSYRLCFHVASTNASAYDVYFDDITVGLQKYDWPGQINLSNSPIDATGWVASGSGVTVATTTTSTDLPLGSPYASSAIKITPVSGTSDYARSRVTVPAALASTMLKAEWYQRPLSGYASGDLKFDVYSNSASDCSGSFTRIALTTDSSSVTSIPNATGKYTTTFLTDGSSVCYEVRFTRVAGTTALNITNFVFGPGIQPQGAVVGPWTEYTATVLNGGTATYSYEARQWRQVGDSIEVMYSFTVTGGGSGSGTVSYPMPNGWTVNSTGLTEPIFGFWQFYSGSTFSYGGSVGVASSSGVGMVEAGTASAIIGSELATGERYQAHFTVKINELAGSGTVNLANNTPEFAYTSGTWDADDSTAGYGPGGGSITGSLSAARTKQVTFQTPIQVTDQIELELSEDGTYWMPASNFATNAGNNFISTTWSAAASATTSAGFYVTKGSTAYKANVIFMRYTWIANDDSPVGDWTNGWKWRLKKFSGSSAVGFGLASSTSAGLVSLETSGTFTASMSGGFSGNPADVTYKYTRVGNLACLKTAAQTGTSNATTNITITGLPTILRPLTTQVFGTLIVYNNTTYGQGAFQIDTSGNITLYANATLGSNTFTGSGTKGIAADGQMLCYMINNS